MKQKKCPQLELAAYGNVLIQSLYQLETCQFWRAARKSWHWHETVERGSKWSGEGRWKLISHILRQDHNNDCNTAMAWAPEGRRRGGRSYTTWRCTVKKARRASNPGMRCGLRQLTGKGGDAPWRKVKALKAWVKVKWHLYERTTNLKNLDFVLGLWRSDPLWQR